MSSKLVPQNPDDLMVIRDVAPGITTLSVPFSRFGRIKIGGRATIVKLTSGSLAVFSPVALTPAVRSKLTSLAGPVSYLIAPDFEHHIFLSAWHDAFPSAKVLGPEGLAEKRAELAGKDPLITVIPIEKVFTKANKHTLTISDEFDRDFNYEYVEAHKNKELVFFHKPSRTLVEADLLFKLPASEQNSRTPGQDATSGLFTRLFGALQHTRGEAIWQKRLLWYALSSSDRPAFNKSIQRINTWDFQNLIPCHGDVILGTAKSVFENVFAWHLKAETKA